MSTASAPQMLHCKPAPYEPCPPGADWPLGGFDIESKALSPLRVADGLHIYDTLDTLTAAAEAGVLEAQRWALQLFHSRRDFEAFARALPAYCRDFRLLDRQWEALHLLAFGGYACPGGEGGFLSGEDIAQALTEAVRATGQAWPDGEGGKESREKRLTLDEIGGPLSSKSP